jgi:putative transposase
MPEHRKRVRHNHEPGDVHELTFSCYRRIPLLTNDAWRKHLTASINDALESQRFRLVAFVYMPEHVHLLVYPLDPEPDIDRFLAAIKRPTSAAIKGELIAADSRLLSRLTIRERPDRTVFRYWQEGPGYDRNLQTEASVTAAIDYVHLNPVRRKLCQSAGDWKWSSARHYQTDGSSVDPELPTIHGLPAEFFMFAASQSLRPRNRSGARDR